MLHFRFLIIFVLSVSVACAQQSVQDPKSKMMDSIKAAYLDQAALMYPRIRQFSITHQENAATNMTSKLYGKDFFKSKFRSSRTTIDMNFPILNKGKNTLAMNVGAIHQFFGIRDITNYNQEQTAVETNAYIPMLNLGATYVHRDSLFGRPITYSASANALVNPSFSSRQFTFRGLINMPIRKTENSNLMAGAIILLDPSAPAPFFLYVSYYHSFRSIGLELMADVPYRLALRKELTKKSSLTWNTEMVGSNSFFEFANPNPSLPKKLTFSTLEIKSGLLYEYRLTKKLVFSASGGLNSTIKSRILEQGAKPKDYFINNKNGMGPYAQVGLSLLPFWSPFKKF